MKAYYCKFKDEDYKHLMRSLECMTDAVRQLDMDEQQKVYTNDEVCKALGISKTLLMRFRQEGLLPFSRVDDKYWYTQGDIEQFISNTVSTPISI